MAARAPPRRYFSDENGNLKNTLLFFFIFEFSPPKMMTAQNDFLLWVSPGP